MTKKTLIEHLTTAAGIAILAAIVAVFTRAAR